MQLCSHIDVCPDLVACQLDQLILKSLLVAREHGGSSCQDDVVEQVDLEVRVAFLYGFIG
jgi:hypothetical protein